MKPEIIIVEQKDKRIIFENKKEFLELLDKFYKAGYDDGKKSNITITTPSEPNIYNPSPWKTQPYSGDTPWKPNVVYTTNNNISTIANDDTKID